MQTLLFVWNIQSIFHLHFTVHLVCVNERKKYVLNPISKCHNQVLQFDLKVLQFNVKWDVGTLFSLGVFNICSNISTTFPDQSNERVNSLMNTKKQMGQMN